MCMRISAESNKKGILRQFSDILTSLNEIKAKLCETNTKSESAFFAK